MNSNINSNTNNDNIKTIDNSLKIVKEDTALNLINENFKGKKITVFPVIHCIDPNKGKQKCLETTFLNIKICIEQGADGVFLINHSFSAIYLIDIYIAAISEFPKFWIGCNFLGVEDPLDFVEKNGISNIKGIWNDQGYILDESDNLYQSFFLKMQLMLLIN